MPCRAVPLSPVLAILLLAAALLSTASGSAAADDTIEMSFEGFGPAGLHVMTTHTTIEENAASYVIQGDLVTAGLGTLFANVTNRSLTQGRQTATVPRPVSFDSETARNGVTQHLRVDYRPDGTPDGSASPPPQEPVTPLDARQLPGTVDSLTAYLMLERQLAHGGGCSLKVPVFDGRHRYDLRFSDAGNASLAPAAGQKFSGTTQMCRMVRDELGGFYVDRTHQEGAHAGIIWYASQILPGELAVPVRMKMDTEIGDVAIYLSQVRARGVSLRLMD